ncbi:MAG TPA: ATP-binding cassette domain-containing protein [Erysipelothrix sp.]|nr:ATP-binding cassette domain-containing protein [Erysipelothrix sp.]
MELKFEHLNKYFGTFHVLKDINFEVKSNRIFGFLGRNGAGKTTSMRILMDVFKSDSGVITLNNKTFNPEDYKIGYLPEERGMYGKSLVKDQLVYFAMLRGANKSEAIESVNYWAKRFNVEHYLDKKLETLSKGNQQKIQITQAFLNEPDILILDEPFSGLDPVNSQLFQDALMEYKNEERLIIFSSHQMSYVETFCDDIAIIDHGEIILKGTLNTIKDEMGGNKLRIISNDSRLDQFLDSTDFDVERNHNAYIVGLNSDMTQQDFMHLLVQQNIDVELLSKYRPSLHDIFVTQVGETK